jgi:DNA-binding LacI/PurR family transcriptional regulator
MPLLQSIVCIKKLLPYYSDSKKSFMPIAQSQESPKNRFKSVGKIPGQPLYRHVEQSIRWWIENKSLVPGDQLPTTTELRRIFGSINHQTIRKAISALADEGIVIATRGRGTFIATNNIRHRRVCLVFPNVDEEYPLRIGDAAGRFLLDQGFDTSWRSSYNQSEIEISTLRGLPAFRVDGAIVYPMRGGHATSALAELQSRRYPLVLVDNQLPNLDLDAVVCDERCGARDLTARLIQMGRKHIFWVGSDLPAYRLGRYAGFLDACNEAAVACPETHSLLAPASEDLNSAHQLQSIIDLILESPNKVDAVIAQSDILALKIGSRLRGAGVQIPGDVQLAGFGGLAIAESLEPSLLSVVQPIEKMGSQAAQLLLKRLNSPDKKSETIILRTHLRVPETAAQT